MNIKDEIYHKIKAEVRLSDDGTLWVKTDKKTLENAQRVIIEDGKTWCKQFYAEQPRRMHGRWQSGDIAGAYCSECEHYTPFTYRPYTFCPNCGADMREESNAQI